VVHGYSDDFRAGGTKGAEGSVPARTFDQTHVTRTEQGTRYDVEALLCAASDKQLVGRDAHALLLQARGERLAEHGQALWGRDIGERFGQASYARGNRRQRRVRN
jgi:hypothetical protein